MKKLTVVLLLVLCGCSMQGKEDVEATIHKTSLLPYTLQFLFSYASLISVDMPDGNKTFLTQSGESATLMNLTSEGAVEFLRLDNVLVHAIAYNQYYDRYIIGLYEGLAFYVYIVDGSDILQKIQIDGPISRLVNMDSMGFAILHDTGMPYDKINSHVVYYSLKDEAAERIDNPENGFAPLYSARLESALLIFGWDEEVGHRLHIYNSNDEANRQTADCKMTPLNYFLASDSLFVYLIDPARSGVIDSSRSATILEYVWDKEEEDIAIVEHDALVNTLINDRFEYIYDIEKGNDGIVILYGRAEDDKVRIAIGNESIRHGTVSFPEEGERIFTELIEESGDIFISSILDRHDVRIYFYQR